MPAPIPALSRKPWPMRWVFIVVLACIVPYTYVRLKYAKANKAFEPYADMKSEANAKRLLATGYRRATVHALPADAAAITPADVSAGSPALLAPAPGGLPDPLGPTLVEPPPLPLGYREVVAPAETPAGSTSRIRFTATVENDRERVGGAEVFVLDNSVVIVPTFVSASVSATTNPATPAAAKENIVVLELPAGLLSPGEHIVTLAGARDSVRWTLTVR